MNQVVPPARAAPGVSGLGAELPFASSRERIRPFRLLLTNRS